MPDLYPVWSTPEITEQIQEETAQFGQSFYFDFTAGDFTVDGAGRLVPSDGYTAWAQWCQKALMTQRGAYMVYTNNYGTDLDQVRLYSTRAARESEIQRIFTEALMADPRTDAVRDFIFSHEGDATLVSLSVYPKIGLPVKMEVNVNG